MLMSPWSHSLHAFYYTVDLVNIIMEQVHIVNPLQEEKKRESRQGVIHASDTDGDNLRAATIRSRCLALLATIEQWLG